MTITRTFAALSLSLVAIIASSQPAQAGDLKNMFRQVRQIQSAVRNGSPRHSPDFGQPLPPSQGYPRPDCHTGTCPPRPPVHCYEYCVYYLDCHGHWVFYRCFDSRWEAESAQNHLRHDGYRTYIKVKHVDHGGYPGGYSAGRTGSVPSRSNFNRR